MQCNAIYIICYTCIVPVYNCTSLSVWNISYLKLFIEYESRKLQSPPNAVSTGHKTVGICGYLNGDFSYVINTFKKDKGGWEELNMINIIYNSQYLLFTTGHYSLFYLWRLCQTLPVLYISAGISCTDLHLNSHSYILFLHPMLA